MASNHSEYINLLVSKINAHKKLGKFDIDKIIDLYVKNIISDDEFLPVLRAIYNNNLCMSDLFFLTNAMTKSGDTLNLTSLGQVVDKHSTGGVSDTTTIVIVPILACLQSTMVKLSGRSLGFTGGTCDKLECFDGYKTDIALDKALLLAKQNGGVMMTSSLSIAPADKKIYALRDKTNLVDNICLIASSIMSKKLATNADILVLDVKYGNGAFMPTKHSAKKLGKVMKKLGKMAGKKVKISYGNMNQPLGYNIGAKLECMEAISVLKNEQFSTPLFDECVKLASLCHALDKNISYKKAKQRVLDTISSGKALQKLKDMVLSQGGSLDLFDAQYAQPTLSVLAKNSGKVKHFNTKKMGEIVQKLISQTSDNSLGIRTCIKLNDRINSGDKLFDIYAQNLEQANTMSKLLCECISIK